ncbi:tripartite tricarboxylate transporter permease [Oricola sp.]|uniref:tripartite tricarboxylate transporter permease n=1 Tax=Oricola sp. TaxID=1979950 RepID=UPI0025F2C783|nr:tripartite tricarboxylate transporter permease [Oricola sp.]MCI5077382.1 tripartite tricarboxylate transporter permease [Oricola sp.]
MGLVDGFVALFSSWQAVLFTIIGTLIGLIGGAVPGLSSGAMISLLIPVTYYMGPLPALAMIYAVSKSSDFGGSIPAILFNTPGTPQASATQIEGFPLTRQGKQGKALRMAVVASAQGDVFSELLLIFGASFLAIYAARLGPPEFVGIYACAFLIIGGLLGKSIVTGLSSVVLGLLLSLVGTDPITAGERFTFGSFHLFDGIGLVPVLLGLFVLSEVFEKAGDTKAGAAEEAVAGTPTHPDDSRLTWSDYKRVFPTICRSQVIGSGVGILPGLGSVVASFVAYSEARRRSKTPETWGKGEIEGIAAAEAANNATSGSNLIPLLTLGIPGSTAAALLSGVMLVHGIEIGPRVFETSHDLVYGIFAAGLLCIATYFVAGYWGAAYLGRLIARIPSRVVYPVIFLTCYVAVYSTEQEVFDMVLMTVFGIAGFVMKKLGMSPAAFIIAFILGPGLERALRQTFLLSDDGLLFFLERPVALLFLAMGLVALVLRLRRSRKA